MKYHRPINWNEVPDVITKEQFYRICHISKSTALYLLKSCAVPCEYSGKKTRCYKIKKADVKEYLESKGKFPEYYSAPKGWHRGYRKVSIPTNMSDATLNLLHEYYADLLSDYKDVITSQEVVKLTGYAKSPLPTGAAKVGSNIITALYSISQLKLPSSYDAYQGNRHRKTRPL